MRSDSSASATAPTPDRRSQFELASARPRCCACAVSIAVNSRRRVSPRELCVTGSRSRWPARRKRCRGQARAPSLVADAASYMRHEQRAIGIDPFQIVHEFFHPAIVRDRRLEQHRARRVCLERAHRNLALLEGYRVAPGVETFDADRAHRSQNSARVPIHDLVGFDARDVFLQQRRARRKNERQPEPSLSRADDAPASQPAASR